jgi:hypothetical protein
MRIDRVYTDDPVRQFLMSVAESRIEAKRLRLRTQRLEAQATKLTASLTGMPRGGGDSGNLLASLADMREDSIRAMIRAEAQEKKVTDFIDRLENPVSRMILKLRYCDCLDWLPRPRRRSVLTELQKVGQFYSESHLFRLHGKALNEARVLYNKENNNEESRDS